MSSKESDTQEILVSAPNQGPGFLTSSLSNIFKSMLTELKTEIDLASGFRFFSKKFNAPFDLENELLDVRGEFNLDAKGTIYSWVSRYAASVSQVYNRDITSSEQLALSKSLIHACSIYGYKKGLRISGFLDYAKSTDDHSIIHEVMRFTLKENYSYLEIDDHMAEFLISTIEGDTFSSFMRQNLHDLLSKNGVSKELYLADKYIWLQSVKDTLDKELEHDQTIRAALANESLKESEDTPIFRTALVKQALGESENTAVLKSFLEKMNDQERKALRHILINFTMADGRIDPNEIKQLEKLYAAMGLDAAEVANDFHRFDSDGTGSTGNTIATSPDAKKNRTFHLDLDVLALHESETDNVQKLLNNVFSKDNEPRDRPVAKSGKPTTSSNILDDPHRSLFYLLITKGNWDHSEVLTACEDLSLMLDGAFETINDWAHEKIGAQLIYSDETISVDLEIANELIAED